MSGELYASQVGTWTLTAPDGRQWTAESGLHCAALEQRERIPAKVMLDRIFTELEPTEDEKRITALESTRDELVRALIAITDQLERVGDTREHKDGQFITDARAALANAGKEGA